MKYTVLNTYDALIQKARKIQQITKFLTRQSTTSVSGNQDYATQSSIFFILDFTQARFLYVDPFYQDFLHVEKTKAPSPEDFTKKIHANDLKILQQHIIPDVLHFFHHQSGNRYHDFAISFNCRLCKKDGSFLSMMLKSNRILTSENNKPLAVTGFMIDITPFKEDSKMILSIDRNQTDSSMQTTSLKSVYFPDSKTELLSNREMEILHHIGTGLCSKEIAEKLYISEFTVNNHRKKMLKKTGCRNTSELMKRIMNAGYWVLCTCYLVLGTDFCVAVFPDLA